MKKLFLFLLAMAVAIAMSAQCGSSSSQNKYSKTTTTQSKKGSTTTYIYSYKKGPTTKTSNKQSHKKKSNCRRNERLMFALSGGATYMLDADPSQGNIPKGEETSTSLQWNPEMLQPISSAFLGYRFDLKGSKRANVIGVWGTMGSHNAQTLLRLFARQERLNDFNGVQGNQFFTEVEGGFLLKEMFRLSGGQGAQNYFNLSGEQLQLKYNVATAGLHIPLGKNISWNSSVSMLFGQDFSQYTLRPSTGISFKFNALRL